MINKIKILLNYGICFIATFILSFFIDKENHKNFFVLIIVTLIFLFLNMILKIDSKVSKKFLIIICCLMLIFSLNPDYFQYEQTTPGIEEHIFAILTILVLPFTCLYEILLNCNLIRYSIIIIPLYFYSVYILNNLLNKLLLKFNENRSCKYLS